MDKSFFNCLNIIQENNSCICDWVSSASRASNLLHQSHTDGIQEGVKQIEKKSGDCPKEN